MIFKGIQLGAELSGLLPDIGDLELSDLIYPGFCLFLDVGQLCDSFLLLVMSM